jgi:hypothetical protein
MTKLEYQELFLFAAKVGALEGYLFNRRKVEPLTNWITHISEMYQDLSPAVKREINPELVTVLQRVLEYGGKLLEPALKEKIEQIPGAAK